MPAKTFGSAVFGIEAVSITIEVNISGGLNYFVVGLPDNRVRESILRIESALNNSDFHMPRQRIIVNLAPADSRKEGSAFDRSAVLGNVGSIICFRLGAADAKVMEQEFYPVFSQDDFVNLPKYHIYIKLLIDGTSSTGFSAYMKSK